MCVGGRVCDSDGFSFEKFFKKNKTDPSFFFTYWSIRFLSLSLSLSLSRYLSLALSLSRSLSLSLSHFPSRSLWQTLSHARSLAHVRTLAWLSRVRVRDWIVTLAFPLTIFHSPCLARDPCAHSCRVRDSAVWEFVTELWLIFINIKRGMLRCVRPVLLAVHMYIYHMYARCIFILCIYMYLYIYISWASELYTYIYVCICSSKNV